MMGVTNALAVLTVLEILKNSASVAIWNAALINNAEIMHSARLESTATHSVTAPETIPTAIRILNVRIYYGSRILVVTHYFKQQPVKKMFVTHRH